jgi:hypothetical protein
MSKDLRRFRRYDEAAEQLVHRPGVRIALVGNSVTDRGVEHGVVERRLAVLGVKDVHVDRFVADSARVRDWYYIVKEYFVRAHRTPDLFVFTFFGNNFDNTSLELGRLAQNFTRLDDWDDLKSDLPRFDDRIQFLLSKCSATIAYSDRIKERVLEVACPGYRSFIRRVNAVATAQLKENEKPWPESARNRSGRFAALGRLLMMLRRENVNSCFVAFPTLSKAGAGGVTTGQPYTIDPDVRRLIAEAGFSLLDLRKMADLKPSMYEDPLHLLATGRPIYSRHLADALAPVIQGGR